MPVATIAHLTSQPAHNAETGVLVQVTMQAVPSELWVLICNRLSAENGHRSPRTLPAVLHACLRHVVVLSREGLHSGKTSAMSDRRRRQHLRQHQRQLAQSGLAASTLG
jgi:hypothetical protein